MTYFAKWRVDGGPPDITVGACLREDIPLQYATLREGETFAVLDTFHAPGDLWVDRSGELRSKADDRGVELRHLTDEMLADITIAAQRRAGRGRRLFAAQILKSAQTIAEAHALLAIHDLAVSDDEIDEARRERVNLEG
jgi:hypothetical protein